MRRAAVLFSLVLLISGCGDRAPNDAVITGPQDQTFNIPAIGAVTVTIVPLEFKVEDSNATALPEIEIEFFAGGGGQLIDLDGNLLNSQVPTFFKTETDDGGVARVSFRISLSGCTSEAQTFNGTVLATVGATSHLWTGTFTIPKCPT